MRTSMTGSVSSAGELEELALADASLLDALPDDDLLADVDIGI